MHMFPAQCWPAAHLMPHAPQLLESIVRSAHMLLHRAATSVPLGVHAHMLLTQSAPGAHLLPHAPQFCGSLLVLTHTVVPAGAPGTGHMTPPLGQGTHMPLGWGRQARPDAHLVPQVPQLVVS
jgi:hypothetical protein